MPQNVFPYKLAFPKEMMTPREIPNIQTIEDRGWFLSVRGKGGLLEGKIPCVI